MFLWLWRYACACLLFIYGEQRPVHPGKWSMMEGISGRPFWYLSTVSIQQHRTVNAHTQQKTWARFSIFSSAVSVSWNTLKLRIVGREYFGEPERILLWQVTTREGEGEVLGLGYGGGIHRAWTRTACCVGLLDYLIRRRWSVHSHPSTRFHGTWKNELPPIFFLCLECIKNPQH